MSAILKTRYHLLDALRGLALVNMIAYHFLWDMVYLFGLSAPWYRGSPGHLWQQCICWTFILLSGICARLGRHRVRRSLLVFGCSVVITLVTLVFMPGSLILFGVLSLIGSCGLITALLDRPLSRVPGWLGAAVCFLLFLLAQDINDGSVLFGLISLPEGLYRNLFTAYLGFPGPGFWSSDYFPVLPWLFLYLTGYFLHPYITKLSCMAFRCRPLEFLGRHSLLIYMAHQPVCYGLSFLLSFLL